MKVLHINAIYGTLSTGTIVRDIHELCIKENIESLVVSPIISKDLVNENIYRIGNIFDEKLHAVLSRLSGKQAYFSTFPTLCLLRYIDKNKPDVVHLHNLHNNFINLPKLMNYLNKRNIQTVITLHDCWFYTGGCVHYTRLNCNRWLSSCGNCPDKHVKLWDSSQSVLEERKRFFNGRKNVKVVGVSDWIRRESIRNVFKGCGNFTVRNGIDLTVFKPSPSQLRKDLGLEGKFVILGPATKWLDPLNTDNLNEFLTQLLENEVLLLFGAKNDQLQQTGRNMQIYGFTHSRSELSQLYSMADVFANCSYEESLSLINVECQACGTPVVTFDNTGMAETVDGMTGFKVKTGDYHALLAACRKVAQMECEEQKKLRFKFISNNFDKNKNYQKLIDIYRSIV